MHGAAYLRYSTCPGAKPRGAYSLLAERALYLLPAVPLERHGRDGIIAFVCVGAHSTEKDQAMSYRSSRSEFEIIEKHIAQWQALESEALVAEERFRSVPPSAPEFDQLAAEVARKRKAADALLDHILEGRTSRGS